MQRGEGTPRLTPAHARAQASSCPQPCPAPGFSARGCAGLPGRRRPPPSRGLGEPRAVRRGSGHGRRAKATVSRCPEPTRLLWPRGRAAGRTCPGWVCLAALTLAFSPGQLSEDLGSEKLCVDVHRAGAGSWLKYVRVACSCDAQNLTMCQVNEQVGGRGLPALPGAPHGWPPDTGTALGPGARRHP
ncbi:Histone-lysine N-methyltransferase PRDM16 [Galemys pyrenaicus]|uniref:Histone-lysine N-methyltransferase PRDM16 n=1 Tax=Galemys pyrenaicus TaxID=202257 RepID=A0A8J5ZR20_GALPY|nr:Histone-lysine N-methyltransferase PRDM16 [Galemys pyrenaicus]